MDNISVKLTPPSPLSVNVAEKPMIYVKSAFSGDITIDRLIKDTNAVILRPDGGLTIPSGPGLVFDRNNTSISVGMGFHIRSGEGVSIEPVDQTDPDNLVSRGWYFAPDGTLIVPTPNMLQYGTIQISNLTDSTISWTFPNASGTLAVLNDELSGNITIGDVTSLQSALNSKSNLSGATFTGNISATNLSGTNTGDQNLSGYTLNSDLAAVATSGDYEDLINLPTLNTSKLVNGVNEVELKADANLYMAQNGGIVFDRNNTSINVGMGFHIRSGEGVSIEPVDQYDSENLITRGWHFSSDGALTAPNNDYYYARSYIVLNNFPAEDSGFGLTTPDGVTHAFYYDYDGVTGPGTSITVNPSTDTITNVAAKTINVLVNSGLFGDIRWDSDLNYIWIYQNTTGITGDQTNYNYGYTDGVSSFTGGQPAQIVFSDGTIQNTAFLPSTLDDYLPLAGGTMEVGATIGWDNASGIREAGAQGLEIECSVGYRWQWVAGRMILRQVNSGQIARIIAIDGIFPSATDDETESFVVGTRWETVDGTVYVCTDSTTDAAIWRQEFNGNASVSIWKYFAKTTSNAGDPLLGYVTWNEIDQITSTAINVSHVDSQNEDIELILGFIQEGQHLFIQDQDSSENFQIWRVSGTPVLTNGGTSTAYYIYPVTLVSHGGTGTLGFVDGDLLLIGLTQTLALHASTHAVGGSDPITPSSIGAADALGPDDNYVTDAEKTVIENTSGTNTGDQDLIGISMFI